MFESYLFTKEQHHYAPVSEQSEDAGVVPSPIDGDIKTVRRKAFFHALFLLEVLHIAIFVLVYGGVHVFSPQWPHGRRSGHALDSYYDLFEYNTVKNFVGDWNKMNRSAESDALFEQIQQTDGVVAIDTEWALRHGFAPSVLHPEDATKGIYQIDMFHSMHCVYRLRNKLTSEKSLEAWPRNDQHTLHCLDYLREQLMCNADLTLEGTDDLLHFNKNSGHVCRSNDAVASWAAAHHWDGHRKFLVDTTGYE